MKISKNKARTVLPLAFVLFIFIAMMIFSSAAVTGAGDGLELCIRVIVPTLLPFFVLSNLLCSLGLPEYLGRGAQPMSRALFGVGGAGVSAFILGLTGGYPLGASAVADLYRSGSVSRTEAQKLLCFCNNSGPAFIIGMAGVGIFDSAAIGLMLYIIHILAAIIVGMILCHSDESSRSAQVSVAAMSFAPAMTSAMRRAVMSTGMISGYIIFFSMLSSVLQEMGLFTLLCAALVEQFGLSIGQGGSLILGVLELGSGIAALSGLIPSPQNLALAAFILGWGGISVQFQTASVLSDTELSAGGGVLGKLLHALISAGLAFSISFFFI